MKRSSKPKADMAHNPHLPYLDKFVAQVIKSCGWQAASPQCISTLTELVHGLIYKIGSNSMIYAHHAGRTTASFYDVQSSISDAGINLSNIYQLRMLPKVSNLITQPPEKPPTVLKIAAPLAQPSYVPDYMNLPFPQPHTYIKTPTYSMPVSSYSNLRESRARQKNEVLNSLSKQLVGSGSSIQLIPGRDDCAWANPETIDYLDYLIVHDDDLKIKKKKRKTATNNIYLQPPKCSWAGLFG